MFCALKLCIQDVKGRQEAFLGGMERDLCAERECVHRLKTWASVILKKKNCVSALMAPEWREH